MVVTEFLLQKWSKGFRMVDADKDGHLTVKDLELLADFISKKTNATPEAAAASRVQWAKWYHRVQPDHSLEDVDEETYKKMLTKMFHKQDEFKAYLTDSFVDLFNNLDLDKDGHISCEEMLLFYEALGVSDKTFVKKVFDTIDNNGDGVIERSEFVDAFVQFWSKPDYPDKFAIIYDPFTC